MAELVEAGCVAFSQANTPIIDNIVLMRAMQYAATFGFRVWMQPVAPFLARGGVAHDGEVAARLGLAGIPTAAETIGLYTHIELARITGAKLHVTRLSSAEGLKMIKWARKEGVDITCDVSINHLHLSEMDIGYFNPNCHLVPPLRTQRDREALRQGLVDGEINALCSNHTPVDDDAKQCPFAEAEPGATGLELLLPLTLKWAQETRTRSSRRLPASPRTRRASSAARRAATFRSTPGPTSASSIPRRTSRCRGRGFAARARTRPSSGWNCPAKFAIPWWKAR